MNRPFSKALLVAVVFVAASVAQARDKNMLGKVLADSAQERAGIEKEFKNVDSWERRQEAAMPRAIPVEIGDELGAESDGELGVRAQHDSGYREKGVASKLDREWKDVNRMFKPADGQSN